MLDINKLNIEDINEGDLDIIYALLDLSFDSMDKEEQYLWIEFMQKVDPEFNQINENE